MYNAVTTLNLKQIRFVNQTVELQLITITTSPVCLLQGCLEHRAAVYAGTQTECVVNW